MTEHTHSGAVSTPDDFTVVSTNVGAAVAAYRAALQRLAETKLRADSTREAARAAESEHHHANDAAEKAAENLMRAAKVGVS